MDNFNDRYVTRWVTTQERFPNKSMLMTGTNNKQKHKTLFNNVRKYKELYLELLNAKEKGGKAS